MTDNPDSMNEGISVTNEEEVNIDSVTPNAEDRAKPERGSYGVRSVITSLAAAARRVIKYLKSLAQDKEDSPSPTNDLTGSDIQRAIVLPPLQMWRLWQRRNRLCPGAQAVGWGISLASSAVYLFAGFLLLVFVVNTTDGWSYRWEQASEARRIRRLHSQLILEFENKLDRAVEQYQGGEYEKASQEFFSLEQFVDGVQSKEVEVYYHEDWEIQHALAIMGRACTALKLGDQSTAETLFAKAVDTHPSPQFPVLSNEGERLLQRVQRQIELESSARSAKNSAMDQNRIRREFNETVSGYMAKLDGYTTTIEGSRYMFSAPSLVGANPLRDQYGEWGGTISWMVYIESTNKQWPAGHYGFLATAGYRLRWELRLKRMQIGNGLTELAGDMERLIPDF